MQSNNQYQLIVFDWDGTLMDSVSRIVASMQSAAKALNFRVPSADEVKAVIGYSMEEALIRVFPECNSSVLLMLTERYRHCYIQQQHSCPLFEGVEDLLRKLKHDGYLLAVATGKARVGLNSVLDETQLGQYFVTTRCADETKSKPHPQMLLEILQELVIPSDKTLMVGDSEMDLTMALNANVDSVGVSYGAHGIEQLKLAKPKTIINQPLELLDFLSV